MARQLHRLSDSERRSALERLPNWQFADGRDALTRTFKFSGFGAALAFMVRAGLVAEKMDHHPEWLNVYDRVEVRLTTHDVGGVTERDLALAEAMDRIVMNTAP